jgi:hypothetical protein
MMVPEVKLYIQEHASIDFTNPAYWPILVLAVLYGVTLAGLRECPRVTWWVPVVWFVLCCDRVRNTPLFSVVMLSAFAEVFPRTRWSGSLATRPDLYRHGMLNNRFGFQSTLLCVSLTVICLGLQLFKIPVPLIGHGWAQWSQNEWPLSLIPELRGQAQGRTQIPIFNEMKYGGFLIYFTPEYRPLIDDRCELFGGKWIEDYVKAESKLNPALSEWDSRYGPFVFALTQPGSGYDHYFTTDANWKLIAFDKAGNFYRQK